MTPFTPLQLSWSRLHGLCESIEKWIDHRTSRRQIKTIIATPYWYWKLSIPAVNMEAGTNELNPELLLWYNNEDVVPALAALQKVIAFDDDKGIDMLTLGFILPKLANVCLHKSTDAKFSPFKEGDEDLFEEIREDVGGPFIVFTRQAVVNETFFGKSTNRCKSLVRIDDSQLNPYSMCQPMLTGLYTHWDVDSETRRFRPRQNKTRSFEIMVTSHFQQTRAQCKIGSFFTTGRQKKIDCFSVDRFYSHCNAVFEAMGCFYHFFSVKMYVPLTEEDIQPGALQEDRARCIEATP